MPATSITTASPRFNQCCAGNTTGALENRRLYLPSPASLPNAITEPENVMAPTNVPMNSSIRLPVGIGYSTLKAVGFMMTAIAMSTAAMPTSECIAATSSGICVICTRRAIALPITPPTAIATSASSTRLVIVSVMSTASAIPMMPSALPRRAVSGWDSPLRARMKRTLAARYDNAT